MALPFVANTVQVEQVQNIETLRSLCLNKIDQLKELTHDKKLIRESLKSIMEADSTLAKLTEDADPLLKEIKAAKARIKTQEDYKGYDQKDKELRDEINDVKDSLSSLLKEYTKLAGVNVIEDASGKEYKIKHKCSISAGQLKLF